MIIFKRIFEKEKQKWNDLSNFGKILEICICILLLVGLLGLIIVNGKGGNGNRFWLICWGIALLLEMLIKLTKWYR